MFSKIFQAQKTPIARSETIPNPRETHHEFIDTKRTNKPSVIEIFAEKEEFDVRSIANDDASDGNVNVVVSGNNVNHRYGPRDIVGGAGIGSYIQGANSQNGSMNLGIAAQSKTQSNMNIPVTSKIYEPNEREDFEPVFDFKDDGPLNNLRFSSNKLKGLNTMLEDQSAQSSPLRIMAESPAHQIPNKHLQVPPRNLTFTPKNPANGPSSPSQLRSQTQQKKVSMQLDFKAAEPTMPVVEEADPMQEMTILNKTKEEINKELDMQLQKIQERKEIIANKNPHLKQQYGSIQSQDKSSLTQKRNSLVRKSMAEVIKSQNIQMIDSNNFGAKSEGGTVKFADGLDSARKPIMSEHDTNLPDIQVEESGASQFDDLTPGELSYKRLSKFMQSNLPMDPSTNDFYSCCCTRVSTKDYWCKLFNPFYYLCGLCYQKYKKQKKGEEDSESEKEEPIDPAVHIGEGTSLYLQMMKTFTIMFLLLTLLNIPLYMVYFENAKEPVFADFHKMFGFFTIGNVGQSSQGCNYASLSVNQYTQDCKCNARQKACPTLEETLQIDEVNIQETIKLSCSANTLITEVNDFGFSHYSDFTRSEKADVHKICQNIQSSRFIPYTFNILNANAEQQKEMEEFQAMSAQKIDYRSHLHNPNNIDNSCNFHTMFKETEAADMQSKIKTHVKDFCVGKAACHIPSGLLVEIIAALTCDCRERIGRKKILADLMVVYKCSGENIQLPVEVQDFFSLEIVQLSKQDMLTALATFDIICVVIMIYFIARLQRMNQEKIEEVRKTSIEMRDFTLQLNNLKIDKHSQDQRIFQMKLWLYIHNLISQIVYDEDDKRHMQIIDISIGSMNFGTNYKIYELQKIMMDIKLIQSQIEAKSTTNAAKGELEKQMSTMKQKFQSKSTEFKNTVRKSLNDNEKFKTVPGERTKELSFVFVTFKNNIARQVFQNNCGKMVFLGNKVQVAKEAYDPDQILWRSLSDQDYKKLGLLSTFIWLGMIAIIVGLHFMIHWIVKDIEARHDAKVSCDDFALVTDTNDYKLMLYQTFLKDKRTNKNIEVGDLACYCDLLRYEGADKSVIMATDFTQFNSDDTTKYCELQAAQETRDFVAKIFYPVIIYFINVIVTKTFNILATAIKRPSTIDRSKQRFWSIVVHEVLNIAFMILVTSIAFDLVEHRGKDSMQWTMDHIFTYDWYMRLSSTICLSIITVTFFSNAIDWMSFILRALQRCCDRGGSFSVKRIDAKFDDGVNSTCRNQEQLNKLYAGSDFEIEKAYARAVAVLFTTMMYTVGLPLLYPLAFVFLLTTYLTNRVLCLKFYNRNNSIRNEIVVTSLNLILFGLICHMVLGFFALTTPQIQRAYDEIDKSDINSMRFAGIDWTLYMTYIEQADFRTFDRFRNFTTTHTLVYFVIFWIIIIFISCLIYFFTYGFNCNLKLRKKHLNINEQAEAVDKLNQSIVSIGKGSEHQQEIFYWKDGPLNFLNEINIVNLKQLYKRANHDLVSFQSIFTVADHGMSIDSDNLKFEQENQNKKDPKYMDIDMIKQEVFQINKINEEEVKLYESLLSNRIKEIETVVNSHFSQLIPYLLKNELQKLDSNRFTVKTNMIEYFKDFDIIQKLDQLAHMQDKLIESNMKHRKNRQEKQYILRMKGCDNNASAQSYSILDHKDFRIGKEIWSTLHEEIDNEQAQEEMRRQNSLEIRENQIKTKVEEEIAVRMKEYNLKVLQKLKEAQKKAEEKKKLNEEKKEQEEYNLLKLKEAELYKENDPDQIFLGQ